MEIETVEIMFDNAKTEEEISKIILDKIDEIEKGGGYIVGAEPIERFCVKIVGRRFTVERG